MNHSTYNCPIFCNINYMWIFKWWLLRDATWLWYLNMHWNRKTLLRVQANKSSKQLTVSEKGFSKVQLEQDLGESEIKCEPNVNCASRFKKLALFNTPIMFSFKQPKNMFISNPKHNNAMIAHDTRKFYLWEIRFENKVTFLHYETRK